ncbi:MAG: tyrosine-type recombinase/integrase [Spiroplasmataceae bacterium]|nr:tyrosine-type recombinase/integrase [Spiroplasmataceae bacterium]
MTNNNIRIYKRKLTNLDLKDYQLWLEDKDLSVETIKNYLSSVKVFGSKEVNTENMREYIKRNLKKQEPSSLLTTMRNLAQYAYFIKQHLDWERIVRLIPKHQRKFFSTLNDVDYYLLRKARFEIEDWVYERNNLMMDFLLYTGVRVSELIDIELSNFENHTTLNVLGKGNKVRQVFLPEVLGKKVLTTVKKSKIYLFTNYKGEKLTRAMVSQIIQERAKKADFNRQISAHTFRRTFATRLHLRGARLTTIQKLMGHSTILTTESYIQNDYYTLYDDYTKLIKDDPNLKNYAE